jgi:hypothetical protein
VAALLLATILVASMISIEVGLSVALIELALGFVVGNAFGLEVPGWLAFVGGFAGIVLTFLAAPRSRRRAAGARRSTGSSSTSSSGRVTRPS